MMQHPAKTFLLWLGESVLAFIVSIYSGFDMNEFRVWSLWALSVFLGTMQLAINRKTYGKAIKDWVREFKKDFKSFLGR